MKLDANKALIRRIFEEVIPAGDIAAMRELVAPEWFDHDPLPGQPAGVEGPSMWSPRCTPLIPICGSRSMTWSPKPIGW